MRSLIFFLMCLAVMPSTVARAVPETYSEAVAKAAMLLAKKAPAVADAEARRDLTCQIAKLVKEIRPRI